MAELSSTAELTRGPRPFQGRWVDIGVRALLVLVAVLALLVGAPTAVTAVLSLTAVAAVGQRLATRGRGGADTVLVAAGGVLVTLVVTGLVLDLAGVPLERRGWALALGAVGLAALAVAGAAPRPVLDKRPVDDPLLPAGRLPLREVLRTGPWAVLSLVVVVVAIATAVRSTGAVAGTPLQVSVGAPAGSHVQVTVAAEQATGPLELRTDSGSGATLSYQLFHLDAGASRVTDVLVPLKGRTVITISNPGQTRPLRSLVVDR